MGDGGIIFREYSFIAPSPLLLSPGERRTERQRQRQKEKDTEIEKEGREGGGKRHMKSVKLMIIINILGINPNCV